MTEQQQAPLLQSAAPEGKHAPSGACLILTSRASAELRLAGKPLCLSPSSLAKFKAHVNAAKACMLSV